MTAPPRPGRKAGTGTAAWNLLLTAAGLLSLLIGLAHGWRHDYAAGTYYLVLCLLLRHLRDSESS